MVVDDKDEQTVRWASEAAHTDEWVAQAGPVRPMDPLTWQRYSSPPYRKHVARELPFSVIGNPAGKRVLDVGCGDGTDSVLLAKLGADVTGVDVSPIAIQRANERAEVNGVADRAHFLCSPLESVDLPQGHFDVIWCWAFLHHLIEDLQPVMESILSWGKPGGLFVFVEPVNLAPWLRRLRLRVPVAVEGTPDERPLEEAELAIIEKLLPDLQMHRFRVLGRLDRFILTNGGYEHSSWARRCAYDTVTVTDYALLKIPGLASLCSIAVGWGHVTE